MKPLPPRISFITSSAATSGWSRFTVGRPIETRPWFTSFSTRYRPGAAGEIVAGMGRAAIFGDGQPAKAVSSFLIISARVNEPDTAAIMLAG